MDLDNITIEQAQGLVLFLAAATFLLFAPFL